MSSAEALLEARAGVALPAVRVPWVERVREGGVSRLRQVGFPTIRDEDWRYTNVRSIERAAFAPAPTQHGLRTDALAALSIAGLTSYRAVFVNGRFAADLSELGGLPSGITLTGLADALEHDAEALETVLGSCAPQTVHGFAALNAAYLLDGAYVRFAPNTAAERPIELLFVSTGADHALVAQPRNLIVAEQGARGTVIERYVALGGARYFTNAVTELVARPGAALEHYKLQEEDESAYHVAGVYVRQERDSRVVSNNVAVGAALARTDIRVSLQAEGAHCDLNGLYLGSGRQHIDNLTRVDHVKPHCSSAEFYKGVLDGRARAVFQGRVVVHADAQHTDAQQENKNLLLSPDAEVDTKPQLEIYADDVKCSHGATVGQLDANALFYLRSRAIDEQTARGLLTYAFAHDVINRLGLAPIRQLLERELTTKLFDGRQIEELV